MTRRPRRPKRVDVADLVGYDDILARTEGISRDYLRALKRRNVIVAVKEQPPLFLWSEVEEPLRAVEARLKQDEGHVVVEGGAVRSS